MIDSSTVMYRTEVDGLRAVAVLRVMLIIAAPRPMRRDSGRAPLNFDNLTSTICLPDSR